MVLFRKLKELTKNEWIYLIPRFTPKLTLNYNSKPGELLYGGFNKSKVYGSAHGWDEKILAFVDRGVQVGVWLFFTDFLKVV